MSILNLPKRLPLRLLLLITCFHLSFSGTSQEMLRTNLMVVQGDGSRVLIDGNLTIYGNEFCNCVDYYDAWKMTNPGENFGLIREGTTLVVERRKIIPVNDTTYIRMWNLQQRNYALQVITKNLDHPDLQGFVKDNYLNTLTPIGLNDTSFVNFTVNSTPGSYAQHRFQVVFQTLVSSPIPVKFTGIKLMRNDAQVRVDWSVENEISVDHYTIQQSSNGRAFTDVKPVSPVNNGLSQSYSEDGGDCKNGDNFYRIKCLNLDGTEQFSPVAKIAGAGAGQELNIYPNPLVGKLLQVQISVPIAGKYIVTAISSNGTRYAMGSIQAGAIQNNHTLIVPGHIRPGIYKIEFYGPGNMVIYKTLSIL